MVRRMIIVVANSKGGVGKSTLAVHLAAWLHEQGHSVTLADCDTQHSSLRMGQGSRARRKDGAARRPRRNPRPPAGPRPAERLRRRRRARAATPKPAGALLLRADLALVPCKARMLEVRALAQATNVLRQAQDIRGGQPQAR